MSASVPKRFVGPMLVDLSDEEILAAVAADRRAIIRHIHYVNATGGAVTFTLSIGADSAATRIFDAYSVAAGAVLDHFCYYVLEAGESLRAHASADDTTTLTIDGDLIFLA